MLGESLGLNLSLKIFNGYLRRVSKSCFLRLHSFYYSEASGHFIILN